MALLTTEELAKELHFTATFVRRLAHRGQIPSMKFGSEYRFDLAQVRESAIYRDTITADARQAARKVWGRSIRRTA
jgi:excisionase family DNA binding protein